jgi:hypothetical protein
MVVFLAVLMLFGNVAGALVVPRERGSRYGVARSAAAIALGLPAVIAPGFLPPDWSILRTVLAFGEMAGFFRLLAIVRHPEWPLGPRIASVVYPVIDARRLAPSERVVRVDAFVVGTAYDLFAVALFFMAGSFPPAAPYSGLDSLMRTVVGGASAYFLVDGTARLSEAILALAGLDIGLLHDAPVLARTVSEFWSRRWNRAVHAWLDEMAFRPAMRLVLRRRPRAPRVAARARLAMAAGVMAAFAASAVLHFIPIWVVYDAGYALSMAAFFWIHGVVVVAEARLGVARWPAGRARLWTWSVFALTAPLFVEPLLRAMGR